LPWTRKRHLRCLKVNRTWILAIGSGAAGFRSAHARQALSQLFSGLLSERFIAIPDKREPFLTLIPFDGVTEGRSAEVAPLAAEGFWGLAERAMVYVRTPSESLATGFENG
jgi:hypothetical protein